MKKYFTVLSLLFIAIEGFSQNCPQYFDALKLANQYIVSKSYDQALATLQLAQTGAKDCGISAAQADNLQREILKKQADDFKDVSDKHFKQFAEYISRLNKMVQKERGNSQAEIASLKADMLSLLISAQTYIDANINNTQGKNMADLHLHLAESFEQSGDIKSAYSEFEIAYNFAKKMTEGSKSSNLLTSDNFSVSYLQAAQSYSSYLLNKGDYIKAFVPMVDAESRFQTPSKLSAPAYDGLARLEMLFGRYECEMHDPQRALTHFKQAIEASKKAITLYPKNLEYVNTLITVYNIMGREQQGKQLPVDSINSYKKIAYEMVGKLRGASSTDLRLINTTAECKINQVFDLLRGKKIQLAYDSSYHVLQVLNECLKINPANKDLLLRRSIVNSQIAVVCKKLPEKGKPLTYLMAGVNDWKMTIAGNSQLPEDIPLLISALTYIRANFDGVIQSQEIYNINESIISLIASTGEENFDYPLIAQSLALLNLSNAGVLEKRATPGDTLTAFDNYSKAITFFSKAGLFKDRNIYSINYTDYCHAFYEQLLFHIKKGNRELAEQDFLQLSNIFLPIAKLYDYDINLVWNLTIATRLYGAFLYSDGKYQQAISPLEYASFHGMKSSTEKLSKIYSKKEFLNASKIKSLETRLLIQRDDNPVVYDIPIDQNEDLSSLKVFILDRPYDYPYKGIEDAAKWAAVAFHAHVDKHYIDAFSKYQYLAWGNKKSFQTLSIKAWEEANDALFILNKYAKPKNAIAQARDMQHKLLFSEALYKQYENDLLKDINNKELIKTDAIPFYLTYAKNLNKSGNTTTARTIYNRILTMDKHQKDCKYMLMELSFNENRDKFSKEVLKDTSTNMLLLLSFYLDHGDLDNARNLKNILLRTNNNAKTRDDINDIYALNGNYDNFEELFLDKKQNLKSFVDYFGSKNIDTTSNNYKRNYYFHLISLDRLYMDINPNDTSVRKAMSMHCNNFIWNAILTKQNYNMLYWVMLSLEYDPNNKYAIANKANAYLIKGELNNAMAIYSKYKDDDFDKSTQFGTYRDFFLSNLNDLKKAGVANTAITDIYNWLINNSTPAAVVQQ